MNSTQAEPSSRPVRASAWISRSRHSARLANPVRGSCSASQRICSSPRRRPSATASTFATPRRKFSWSALTSPSTTTQSSPKTSSPVRISTFSPAPFAGPKDASVSPSRATTARTSGSVSRIRSTASVARSPTSAPARARSPSAATAATWRDWRCTLASASRCAVMSRPIASSSGPASVSTIPQLISPTNSEPSLRKPSARIVNRSG